MWGTPGVFSAEGDDWRRIRRLAVTALNSNHLQRYFEIVSTCAERLRRRLEAAARDGRPVEIGEALSSFTVDVTSWLAFGHDLNTLERGDGELQGHLHRVFHMTNRRLFSPVPYWRWLKLPADRALDRSLAALRPAVRAFMDQTRERIAARPELSESPENFLEGMIAAQENDGAFSDDEILANVFTLLLAGEDTTSHTMAWTIWSLATMPEVQERWAEEASRVLGERPPSDPLRDGRGAAATARASSASRCGSSRSRRSAASSRSPTPRLPGSGSRPGTRIVLLHRFAGLQDVARADEFRPERWLEEDGLERPRPEVLPRLRRRSPLLPRPQPRLPRGEDRARR